MKKKSLIFGSLVISGFLSAQTGANVFPTAVNSKVGIGTNSPANRLDVVTYSSTDEGVNITQGGNGKAMLKFSHLVSGKNWFLLADKNGNMDIKDDNASRLFFAQGNNMGIGTITPGYKLHLSSNNALQDGVMISQSNALGTSNLYLNHTLSRNWSFFANNSGVCGIRDVTASVYRLYFDGYTGNTGIGLADPQRFLHLRNPSITGGDVTIRLDGSNAGGRSWDFISATAAGGNAPAGNFAIMDNTTNTIRMLIDNNGKVGIGTNLPQAQLTVNDDVLVGGNTTIYGSASIGGVLGSERMNVSNGNLRVDGRIGINCSPSSNLEISDPSDAKVMVMTGTNNKASIKIGNAIWSYDMLIDATGVGRIAKGSLNLLNYQENNSAAQVWIGTKPTSAHTDFNFAVGGKLVAQSVYVTLNCGWQWADYVFAPDYKLPKLSDVESYYKANRHLPEIPSASEVEKQGINVGEMNTLLLKKVEELTLYMVDLNKKVEALEAENKNLKKH